MKRCYLCNKLKAKSSFVKDKSRRSGIVYRCKPCEAIRCGMYYSRNRRTILDRQARYLKKHKYKGRATYSTDEKVRVRFFTRQAIRSNKLKRQPCDTCGNPKSQVHHIDYSKPLKVRWLCSKCHGIEHRKYK